MWRPHASYANVTSTLALVVALSGVSYAAVTIPKNSVGSAQVINGSLTGQDVKNNSLRGRDIVEGSLGKVPNAAHINGLTGTELRFGTVVPSGTTVRGSWGYDSEAAGAGGDYRAFFSYGAKFADRLTVEYAEGGTTAHCTGTAENPTAAPGYVCSYLYHASNATVTALAGTFLNTRFGSAMSLTPSGAGDFYALGTWAATAP